jgi:hypothetical protein
MALTPHDLVQAHLKISRQCLDALSWSWEFRARQLPSLVPNSENIVDAEWISLYV